MEVVLTRLAISDIAWTRTYIARFNPMAADRMARRLREAALSLSSFPDRGRLRPDGLRELTIIFPYLIIYRVEPNRITIVTIRHGARKPE